MRSSILHQPIKRHSSIGHQPFLASRYRVLIQIPSDQSVFLPTAVRPSKIWLNRSHSSAFERRFNFFPKYFDPVAARPTTLRPKTLTSRFSLLSPPDSKETTKSFLHKREKNCLSCWRIRTKRTGWLLSLKPSSKTTCLALVPSPGIKWQKAITPKSPTNSRIPNRF